MANDYYNKEWQIYLKCKECWKFKELCDDNRYKHKEWFLWVLGRCKECIKNGRKTERERVMARVRDSKRYYNNEHRRQYVFNSSTERRKIKWYGPVHLKTDRIIKKMWARPKQCPFCWSNSRIVAHHYDYNKPLNVVFCCDICHSRIHNNKISEKDVIEKIVVLN